MTNQHIVVNVSVIMPAYNAEKYIMESISSVIKQTYPLWELLIIDDGSQDATREIVKRYMQQDQRIKLIEMNKNIGVAQARNCGIENAKGEYIAFLDSDDIWLPQKLEWQIAFMQENSIGFSYTQYRQFEKNVEKSGKLINVEECIDYKLLLRGNAIGCLTVMINRAYIPRIYMPSCKHEDYATWLNILRTGIFAYGLKKDLARYRKTKNSLSRNKFKSLLWTWNIYREIEGLNVYWSIYYVIVYALKGIKKHFKFCN
jgi:glycosyltransferase involved in cell wall biosynthesis